MRYMTPIHITDRNKHLYNPERWGQFKSPGSWTNEMMSGYLWALDNGMFTGWKVEEYEKLMDAFMPFQESCLFVTVIDSVGNSIESLDRFRWYAPMVVRRGYRTAFVAQDGQESLPLPPEYDCLFIGGSTDWKLSNHVAKLIKTAKEAGKWVHVGRVNTQNRIRHFQLLGVDSVDGTAPIYGENINVPRLDKQLKQRILL